MSEAIALPFSPFRPLSLTQAEVLKSASSRSFPNSITVDWVLSDRLSELVRVCGAAAERGWDGDDGLPVTAATYVYAREFLATIPSTVTSPEIAVHPDGEVEFEWFSSPDQVLTLSIGSSGVINYAALARNEKPQSGRVVFAGSIPAPIARLLAKVASPAK